MENKDLKQIQKKINKIIKKEKLTFPFVPIKMGIKCDGRRTMEIECNHPLDEATKNLLYNLVSDKMNLVMIDKHDTIEQKEAI